MIWKKLGFSKNVLITGLKYSLVAVLFASCNRPAATQQIQPTPTVMGTPAGPLITISTPTRASGRSLTICMGSEPGSLFYYGDGSQAANNVRQAIYDGPFDVINYELVPVILERMPSLENGDITIEPLAVKAGNIVVDLNGDLAKLGEGIQYLPSGCLDASCAQTYSGQEPVQVDQLAVRFKLIPGLKWSDGAPLTIDDSLYSFEVAQAVYPKARGDLVAYTESYRALDETTIEWRGVPGYQDSGAATFFFAPLPRHAWGQIAPDDLFSAEASSRQPLGWGAYMIDEWLPGESITLIRNPNYFRLAEGLPKFDQLIFRFTENPEQALAALQNGECDILDETSGLETRSAQLQEQQVAGQMAVTFIPGTAWEHLDFGIASLNPGLPPIFQKKETRQAMAQCIDRQRITDELYPGLSQVPDSYVLSQHPLHNPNVRTYLFDPQTAATLLEAAGWADADGNPATPRTALGVEGVPDGTPLATTLLTTDDEEKQLVAAIIKDSLAQCGVQVEINNSSPEVLFAPGPEGPIFGRNFALAQFGWETATEPPCFLYTTQEVPGPYPQYPKGWGGANASGYSNPEFDLACQRGRAALPENPQHQDAHHQAQAIFAEDIPSIPLYTRFQAVATRLDLCGLVVDASAESSLTNLEEVDYGSDCVY